MIKRVTSTKETSTKTADDTRNFIRKKRTTVESKTPPQSEVKSEPKVESKPKVKSQPTSDNVAENAKREELAKEALATRSNKTLPKGFNEESASGGPHSHDEKPEESQINSENNAEQLQKELAAAKAEKEQLEREEESQNEDVDLATELKNELENLRKELESVDDDSDSLDTVNPEDAKDAYAAEMKKKGATLPKGFIKDAKANTGH